MTAGYSEEKIRVIGGVWLTALAIVAGATIACSAIVSQTDTSRHEAFEACVSAGQHPLECEEGLHR